jgi:hypothetical protein
MPFGNVSTAEQNAPDADFYRFNESQLLPNRVLLRSSAPGGLGQARVLRGALVENACEIRSFASHGKHVCVLQVIPELGGCASIGQRERLGAGGAFADRA